MLNNIDITKQKIQGCFNKAAPTYDHNNAVQQAIGANLIVRLCQQPINPQQIIDLGCGSGVVTEKLATSLPYTLFHAVDISPALLTRAQHRLAPYPIHIYAHDFEQLAINNTLFDLAFSNMALHWSIHFEQTLKRIHQHLVTGGVMAFSIPIAGTFVELRHSSINPFYPLSAIVDCVSQTGFDVLEQATERMVIPFDSMIAALKSIKAVGANYLFKPSHHALKGKAFLQEIATFNTAPEEPFPLTYHIGYVIARKR